jgi:hypothetical protein
LAEATGSFELGKVVGQQEAFGLVAGRCSAAAAAALRRIREERIYKASGLSWHEFCPRHLGISRTQADRLIGQFEEFGPEFFELTQLTRIPPDAYRAIAHAVKDRQIHWQGEAIALIPENSARVAAAVAGLREAARPAAPVPALEPAPHQLPAPAAAIPAASNRNAVEALKLRSGAIVAEWSKLVALRCTFAPADRQAMRNTIGRTRQDLERLERQVWLQRAPGGPRAGDPETSGTR